MYLVRAHFRDIISPDLVPPNDSFNFFIYSHYKEEINLAKKVKAPQILFYYDFVVDSVESGFVNVSIGGNQDALLNGLEIMELLKNSDSNTVYVVVGCVLGGVDLVVLISSLMTFKYQKTKFVVGTEKESNVVPSYDWSSYMSTYIDFTINHELQIPNLNLNLGFQFADILQATNSFDEKLVIGKGGFGKVYRGILPDGKTIAVKRGKKGHGQGQPKFVTEIMVLSKILHQYLVTLIGYCDAKSEMILVYKFMEKCTLQDHLYETEKDVEKLSWSQRL
ncbi:putative protein kinase RLK-Pelle-CrRLK1L-1 family [Helianthus debilis subsp. tardiflorus]